MKLSKQSLQVIPNHWGVKIPDTKVFSLPEKVLQFGTGVFLRGLIDYLIDKANNQGVFNGSVVAVKSTDSGNVSAFEAQDHLYTLIMKSVESGEEIEEIVICGAISRVLKASDQWDLVLQCAANPNLEIIISNTTEIGITKVDHDSIDASPPVSFPAKLLRFLQERYTIFKGADESGLVIIPTELIPDNATKLKKILNELAKENGLERGFIEWLNHSNEFCNSLVDRIVPGTPPLEEQHRLQEALGYEDDLMVMSETFALWAIETRGEKAKNRLTFSQVHPQVYLIPNIDKFRELKLRLLNGSHNLSCALGFLAGFQTVKEAMAHTTFDRYMITLIQHEIVPAIVSEEITLEEATQFGAKVLNRYHNPHIEFEWLDICVQDTAKIKIRAVPIVVQCYEKNGFVSECLCLSFAAYILFMKSEKQNGQYTGRVNGKEYTIQDDFAENLYVKWHTLDGIDLVKAILGDATLWGLDLSKLKDFPESVYSFLVALDKNGFEDTVRQMLNNEHLLQKHKTL